MKKSKRRRGPSKPQGMTYMDTVSTSAKMHEDWIEAEVQRRFKKRGWEFTANVHRFRILCGQ